MKMLLTIALSALCISSTAFCSDLPSLSLQEVLLHERPQTPRTTTCSKRSLVCSTILSLGLGVGLVIALGKPTTTPCQSLTIPHCGRHCQTQQLFPGICPPPPGRGYDTGSLFKYCSLTTGDKITVGQDTECTQTTCRSFAKTEELIHATCPISLATPAPALTAREKFDKRLAMLRNTTGR